MRYYREGETITDNEFHVEDRYNDVEEHQGCLHVFDTEEKRPQISTPCLRSITQAVEDALITFSAELARWGVKLSAIETNFVDEYTFNGPIGPIAIKRVSADDDQGEARKND